MGLGHLCGGGGIRGETVEYGTEYGVTAGDLCLLTPHEESNVSQTTQAEYSNPLRFKRSDGKYVYIYNDSNGLQAAVETGDIQVLHTSTDAHMYTFYDGYLVDTDLVHLFVYNRDYYDTSLCGLRVVEINISSDTISLTKVVFEVTNGTLTNAFGRPSNFGNSPIHKLGDSRYVFIASIDMAYPIFDNGQTFVMGNGVSSASMAPNASYKIVSGLMFNSQGVLKFLYNSSTNMFGYAFKYTYSLGANNTPELTITQITPNDCTHLQEDRYTEKSFLFTIDETNYILINNSERGVFVAHYTLTGNTLNQIGASLSVSVNNRAIIAGLFEGKIYIYSYLTGVSASVGWPISKQIIDVTNAPELLSNNSVYVRYSMWSDSVSSTKYTVEYTKFRMLAYLQYNNTIMQVANFKPMDTVESSPNALYAMGSVSPDDYGKFRVQPEED